jgi:hypothetical protein
VINQNGDLIHGGLSCERRQVGHDEDYTKLWLAGEAYYLRAFFLNRRSTRLSTSGQQENQAGSASAVE